MSVPVIFTFVFAVSLCCSISVSKEDFCIFQGHARYKYYVVFSDSVCMDFGFWAICLSVDFLVVI